MAAVDEFARERLELASVLNSGIFNRAPNLALVLKYVCSEYFKHGAEQLKEYNIAVEGLGRPAEFDPRGDSIVRVEAHLLRKRLKEYYDAEGSSHSIQIEIPSGQYAPRFVYLDGEKAVPGAAADVPETTAAPRPHRRSRAIIWIAGSVMVTVVAVFAILQVSRGYSRPLIHSQPAAAGDADTVRIACGSLGGTYVDHFGNTWNGDSYFQGGITVHDDFQHIRGTRDQRLYSTRREGAFRYDIPLKPGIYELRLHFAETIYGINNPAGGGESSRVFGIAINGNAALPHFDIISDAEPGTADIKIFKDISPASDGHLHLQFSPVSNMPVLSGIEITPGIRGHMRPIRMVAQEHAYTDSEGRRWEPDRYAFGGTLASRNDSHWKGAGDPDLYRGERFGNISYVVPVADGRYRVRLHFSEAWFGPGKPGGGPGAGSRTFDILCNGVAIRRELDIFKEAGGPERALTVDIPAVVPNHQGKIVISLVPAENYACINALEILDESE